jgi:hypothetical protein
MVKVAGESYLTMTALYIFATIEARGCSSKLLPELCLQETGDIPVWVWACCKRMGSLLQMCCIVALRREPSQHTAGHLLLTCVRQGDSRFIPIVPCTVAQNMLSLHEA